MKRWRIVYRFDSPVPMLATCYVDAVDLQQALRRVVSAMHGPVGVMIESQAFETNEVPATFSGGRETRMVGRSES